MEFTRYQHDARKDNNEMKRKFAPLSLTVLTALLALGGLFGLLRYAPPAFAAAIVVTADDVGGSGCSLRDAIEAANTNTAVGSCNAGDSGLDLISLGGQTYVLNSGEVTITEDLIISGVVSTTSIIDADQQNRLLYVTNGSAVTLTQVTLQRGLETEGGALYVDSGDVTLLDGRIYNNIAPYGGGVFVGTSGASFTLESGTIISNTAPEDADLQAGGGGVYVDRGTFTMNGGVIRDNLATTAVGNSFPGGGLQVDSGTATLNGGQIINNTAFRGGGAIVNGGVLNLVGTLIVSNTATAYGGGLYQRNGIVNISGGEIAYNQSQAPSSFGGGGIYQFRGTLNMSGGSIHHNTALHNGGGAIFGRDTTISGGTIAYNSAGNEGGGIRVRYDTGNFQMSDATLIGNTPSAITVGDEGTAVLVGNTIINHDTVFELSGSGFLTTFANNVLTFTTGVSGTGVNARHNWWGAINPVGVNDSDADDYRLGAAVLSWSTDGTLADSNGGTASIAASSGAGTAVIVNHGRAEDNFPFGHGTTVLPADLCSDHYDFFVVDGSAGATFNVTLPVDNDTACNSAAAGGSAETNILRQFVLDGGAPDDSCSSSFACWPLYAGTINRNGGAPYTLTAIDVPLAQLGGTPFAVGGKANRLTIDDVTVDENDGTAVFTVSLSSPSDGGVSIDFATADGTAVADDDYAAQSGTLSFPLNSTEQTITITIDEDTLDETVETFTVTLSAPSSGLIVEDDEGIGTITDNDDPPTLTLADPTVAEGDSGDITATFTVTLSTASGLPISVNYATADDTAVQPADYTATSGTLSFDPLETTKTISVTVNGDTLDEGAAEQFYLNFSSVVNGQLSDTQAVGTITDDDDPPTLTLADTTVAEGDSGDITATFTVTLSAASGLPITVTYATAGDTAAQPADYTATAGTLSFDPGETEKTVTVTVSGDTIDEGASEQFFLNFSDVVNGQLPDTQAVGTITDDDDPPTLTLADPTVAEGDGGSTTAAFTVTLSNASSSAITVNYATADDTAVQPADYTATSGTLSFAPLETTKTISVTINGDTLDEGAAEQFFLNFSDVVNGQLPDTQAVGTITDDDDPPTLTLADTTVAEGDSGDITATFTVTLSAASGLPITVNYATADDTAAQPADYTATAGTLSFDPGETEKTITVTVKGDTLDEGASEQFFLNFSDVVNGQLPDTQAVGTITDDDDPPTLILADASVVEGDSGGTTATFTVTLSAVSGLPITVTYATADDTAAQPADYITASGILTFTPGITHKTITVTVNGEEEDEGASEQFFLNFSDVVNGQLPDTQAVGTIVDDDGPPTIILSDTAVNEGDSGSTTATFTVTLSVASGLPVTVTYATADDTAVQPADYITTSGTLSFDPGITHKTITVTVNGDTAFEGTSEQFFLNFSNQQNSYLANTQAVGTITDNDDPPALILADTSIIEGDDGDTTATFTVTLAAAAGLPITVTYATADDTAVHPADYTATAGTLTFNPGETEKTITVTVKGDTLDEGVSKQFFLNFSDVANGQLPDSQAVGTIIDDDDPPTLFLADTSVVEKTDQSTTATFTVTLSAASGLPITVAYATADGTAVQPADYIATAGTLSFAPGETAKTVSVTVNSDAEAESSGEQFFGPALSDVVSGGAPRHPSSGHDHRSTTTIMPLFLPTIHSLAITVPEQDQQRGE
jgi:hypothetical protein